MWQLSGPRRAKAALLLSLASVAFAAPLDCSDGQSDNTVYNTTVGSYDIIYHVDCADGNVTARTSLASFEDYLELCDSTPKCIDVSYAPGGTCWLKASVETPVSDGGIWTGRSRLSRTDNEVTYVNNKSNGTIYDAEDRGSYQVLCGIDYTGNDLTVTSESSFSACVG